MSCASLAVHGYLLSALELAVRFRPPPSPFDIPIRRTEVRVRGDVPEWLRDLAGPGEVLAWVLLLVLAATFVGLLVRYLVQQSSPDRRRMPGAVVVDSGALALGVLGLLLPWYSMSILDISVGGNAFAREYPIGAFFLPAFLMLWVCRLSCLAPGRRFSVKTYREAGWVVILAGIVPGALAVFAIVFAGQESRGIVGIGIGPITVIVSAFVSLVAGIMLVASPRRAAGGLPPQRAEMPVAEAQHASEAEWAEPAHLRQATAAPERIEDSGSGLD